MLKALPGSVEAALATTSQWHQMLLSFCGAALRGGERMVGDFWAVERERRRKANGWEDSSGKARSSDGNNL